MRFEKVAFSQYLKDVPDEILAVNNGEVYRLRDNPSSDNINMIYQGIKMPRRATSKSAGYDFFSPYTFQLNPGETIKIATGIKALVDDDKWLMCLPRSSHGFKARVQLDNTVGVIDADYYNNEKNEGHIWIKLTNDSNLHKSILVEEGEAFFQGIIVPYFTTEDDESGDIRKGGIGST